MYVSRHHGQTLVPKRPKFGMCSIRIWLSIIKHMWAWQWVCSCHSHTHWNLLWLLKANSTTNQTEIWNEVSKQLGEHFNYMCVCVCVCINGCGLVIATPIGQHYAYQKLIYGPIRLIFGIWIPSSWVSINNCMWVWQ